MAKAMSLIREAENHVRVAREHADSANDHATRKGTPVARRIEPTYQESNDAHKNADAAGVKIGSAKGFAWQAKTMLQDAKLKLSSRALTIGVKELDQDNRLGNTVEELKSKVTGFLAERDGLLAQIGSRAKEAGEQAASAKSAATAAWELLPRDPPLDSILHSVKFTVTANAHATPNWTLERFRGPGLSAPFASAQRQRIHELTIVLGAPAEPGGKALSDEQSRQLLNQRLDSLRLLVVPVN